MEKKKNGKKIVIISISAVLVIALAVCFFIFIMPMIYYNMAENLFANEDYAAALEEYKKAGTYSDARAKVKTTALAKAYTDGINAFNSGDYALACEKFLEAGEHANSVEWLESARLGEHYTNGLNLFSEKKYEQALEELTAAGTFQGAADKILEVKYSMACGYMDEKKELEAAKIFSELRDYNDSPARLTKCANSLFEQERYEEAETAFELDRAADSSAYKNYCGGKVAMVNKNYSSAVSCFGSAKTIKDGEQLYIEASYLNGKDLFSKKDYTAAKIAFGYSKDYNDSSDMIIACDLMCAEQKLKDGDLKAAQTAFNKLPDDYEYNDIKASERKALLAKYQSFIDLEGKWMPTYNYIYSRHIYKRNSSWEEWNITDVVNGQNMEIKCKFNSDNTITISGSAKFVRFTDYSSIAKYADDEYKTISFEARNVTSIPNTITINDNTYLSYSNGCYTLNYSYKDNYSQSFYNVYSSTVTYGKKTA